jgi:hypothetical protein
MLVITVEDIYSDCIIINKVFNLIEEIKKTKTKEDLTFYILTLSRVLQSIKYTSRSSSYIKMLMIQNKSDDNIKLFEKYINSGDVINAALSCSKLVFHETYYTKSRTYCAASRDKLINYWKIILNTQCVLLKYNSINNYTIENETTIKAIALCNLFRIWLMLVSHHKEAFLFFIKAMLLTKSEMIEYKEDIRLSKEDCYKIINDNINLKITIPDYALDCHTGKFKKGSKEGNEHFVNIGSLCVDEKLEVEQKYKDNYCDIKLGIKKIEEKEDEEKNNEDVLIIDITKKQDEKDEKEEKEDELIINIINKEEDVLIINIPVKVEILVGKNRTILNDIEGKKIIKKVQAQLPCGTNRPKTWIVKTEDGKNYWLKENKSTDFSFQLMFDSIKLQYGIIPLKLKYDNRGFLYCPSVYNDLDTLKTVYNRDVLVIDVTNTRCSTIDNYTDNMIKQIMRICALRGIYDVTDSHLTNMMCINGKIISYDEMGKRGKGVEENIWKFLFTMIPRKNIFLQFEKWLKGNKKEYYNMLSRWKFVEKEEEKRKEYLLKLINAF